MMQLVRGENGVMMVRIVPPQTASCGAKPTKGAYCFTIDISGRCALRPGPACVRALHEARDGLALAREPIVPAMRLLLRRAPVGALTRPSMHSYLNAERASLSVRPTA